VPGVREHGGQYTHGAIWAAMAVPQMGDHDRAWDLATMINPVNHASTPEAMAIYKVEPYVIAADVYTLAPHTGRGGWSWYTGSAGWMYRLIVESLLGITREGDRLRVTPCLPASWTTYMVHYTYGDTLYEIAVVQVPSGCAESPVAAQVTVDGVAREDGLVHLTDDGVAHQVMVEVCAPNVRERTDSHDVLP
jgi:cellobiose phosphorylase